MIGRLLVGLFRQTPPGVTAADANTATNHGTAVLLDVREPHEWQAGHAPQAHQLPLSQLNARLAELPEDRKIITVCRSGHRSALAAEQLTAQGHEAVSLTGGMAAWVRAGLPVVTDNGHSPGRIV